MRILHGVCSHHALLPQSLAITPHYNTTGDAMCRGGFGEVWKGQHRGQEVAVKVLKVYKKDDLEKIRRVGFWRHSCSYMHQRLTDVEVLQGGYGMEDPPSSKHIATVRCYNVRESVRDGIEVDGAGQYR